MKTTEKIALEFSRELLKWLGRKDFQLMVKKSKENTDASICVSHDFCDSNVAMLKAYKTILGYEPEFNSPLWNDAWTIAVKTYFFHPLVGGDFAPPINALIPLKTFRFEVEYEHKGRLNGFATKITTIKAKTYAIAIEKVRKNFKTIYDISEI